MPDYVMPRASDFLAMCLLLLEVIPTWAHQARRQQQLPLSSVELAKRPPPSQQGRSNWQLLTKSLTN